MRRQMEVDQGDEWDQVAFVVVDDDTGSTEEAADKQTDLALAAARWHAMVDVVPVPGIRAVLAVGKDLVIHVRASEDYLAWRVLAHF